MLNIAAKYYLQGTTGGWTRFVREFLGYLSASDHNKQILIEIPTIQGITLKEVLEECLFDRNVIELFANNNIKELSDRLTGLIKRSLLIDKEAPHFISLEVLFPTERGNFRSLLNQFHDEKMSTILLEDLFISESKKLEVENKIVKAILNPSSLENFDEFDYAETITDHLNSQLVVFLKSTDNEWEFSPLTDVIENSKSLLITNSLSVIDLALYKTLIEHPELLKTLNWRSFEKLLADMLETFGYEVSLMQGTKDGGIDIIAFMKNDHFGTHKYLLQAKRWTNKVGVDVVKNVLFNHDFYKASKSCLATTATFTKDAWHLAELYRWQLELKDYNAIQHWLENAYKRKTLS
jgi:restriction system protein